MNKSIYVVRHKNYDTKKGEIQKIFTNEEDAYNYCVEKLNIYFSKYTVLEEEIKEDDEIYNNDEEIIENKRIQLFKMFKDETKSFKQRYYTIANNLKLFFTKKYVNMFPIFDILNDVI